MYNCIIRSMLFTMLACIGCSKSNVNDSLGTQDTQGSHSDMDQSSAPRFTSRVQRLVDWQGHSIGRVVESFGEPFNRSTFNPNTDSMPEYRVEILNVYPRGNPQSDVFIQEYTYQYEDGSRMFFWFHEVNSDERSEWLVLQAMKVAPGVKF